MCHQISQVFLPLEKLGDCHACQTTAATKICSACGERAYCSQECQSQDWKDHKLGCGKTDRIDLEHFYPFLAWMYAYSHMTATKPIHPALQHKIINDVNPYVTPTQLPDGWEAKLVMIDDTQAPRPFLDHMDWFPLAYSPKVAGKMFRRIALSGYVLPILTAVASAILAEMYTTTSGAGSSERRVRLKYRSSPISDFGIATGSAVVTPQDRLAYYRQSDGSIFWGQDPDDHYWLYFTTTRGEEVLLDCAMFPFNMCQMVDSTPYVPAEMPMQEMDPALSLRFSQNASYGRTLRHCIGNETVFLYSEIPSCTRL
ncbi:unnamed protein product [Somion occarium]|uniref:MYND-type domain-containing protein n=1 Tax=Somion occarium TaxID=3059160 RepID=A0ABP1DJN7_9APHY